VAVCGKRVTLADEVNTRRSAAGTEEADGMLSGSGSGLGAIPLPNVGSMGGECEPLRKRAPIAEEAMPSKLGQLGVSS
jgi:hypothetical protein